jgi:hypothetical protein
MSKLNYLEDMELAIAVLGINEDECEDIDSEIDNLLAECYEIDLQTFSRIAGTLLDLIDVGTSPITGEKFKGFAKDGCWLVKRRVGGG